MKMRYTQHYNVRQTPQSQAIPGKNQVKNSAGGYAFKVDDWDRLSRFLILGSEGGSYYSSEKKLTLENAKVVERLLKVDGIRVVNEIISISVAGRAAKNDPAIFALGMAMKLGDEATRKAAGAAVPKVCRTGTHILQLAKVVNSLGGWGRGTRRAFARWYEDKDLSKLEYQMVKYQQRDGWSHRDVMRLAHPKTDGALKNELFSWVTKKTPTSLALISAQEMAKTKTTAGPVAKLIRETAMPRECVPTQFLKDPQIWDALLEHMPMTAMIRNLGNMSKSGLLSAMSDAEDLVVNRLQDADRLRYARVHPLNILSAFRVYGAGRGLRGSGVWTPSQRVLDALDDAFYASFEFIKPTGKRMMLAIDRSGSMTAAASGVLGLTAMDVAAVMAMVTAKTEAKHVITGFSADSPNATTFGGRNMWGRPTSIEVLNISPKKRLDDVLRALPSRNFGGTDCALPMRYALDRGLAIDAFCVYTDNESWAGTMHPSQALQEYRRKTGIPAKLVAVAATPSGFSVADPDDAGMMDVVGFDTAAPALIADFIRN